MNKYAVHTPMLLLAAGLLSATPAISQEEPIVPDLAKLAAGTGAKVSNRAVTSAEREGRPAIRFDERAGDGVAWWPDLKITSRVQPPASTTNKVMNTSSTIEPKIIRRDKFLVMGTQTQLTPETETGEKYGAIWRGFEKYRGRLQTNSTDQKYYGASFATAIEGCLDYVAGMAVKPGEPVPSGLVIREVPAATYAVFACPVAAIGPTKRYIFAEWRSKSAYQVDTAAPAFEQYPPAEDTESPVLIHIPIREKQAK